MVGLLSRFRMDWIAALLLLAGLLATWLGVRQYAVMDEIPGEPALSVLLIAVVVWALGSVVRGVIAENTSTALGVVWMVALVVAVGFPATLSTTLLVFAALGLGWKLVPEQIPARALLALVVGMALIAGVLGWLLPFPIHSRGIYLLGLLLVVGFTWNSIRTAIGSVRTCWEEVAADSPAAFTVLVVGLAGASAWLPTIMFDDLVYHLALPTQLVHLEYYRLDPASQLWALAPWASDVIHAIPMVLAREEARGAVNLVWLGICAALVGAVARSLGLNRTLAWLAAALFASLPLSGVLVLSMQTELPSTAAVFALALTILHAPRSPDRRTLLLAAILSAFLMALKTSNALAIIAFGVWLFVHWRGRLPWRKLPLMLLIGLFLGGASYFFAGWVAGNPVLPLYNDIFGSEYARLERFRDSRWDEAVHWDLFWSLTFEVREFYSGRAGSTGYVLVALIGGVLLALLNKALRAPAVAALAITVMPLVFAPYMRYAFPGIALLIPVLVAGIAVARPGRLLVIALAGMTVFQLTLAPNASYIFWNSALKQRINDGETAILEKYAPERLIAEWIHDTHQRSARIFMADPARPYTGAFAGQAFGWSWYDRELQERVRAFKNPDLAVDWRDFWREHGFTHVIVYGNYNDALRTALADADRVFTAGRAELWRLPDPGNRDLAEERNFAQQLPGGPGT